MTKLYTKTGDKGLTHGPGKSRIFKYRSIIYVLGDIDELCSNIGVVKNTGVTTVHLDRQMLDHLQYIQDTLMRIGSLIYEEKDLTKYYIQSIEFMIDSIDEKNTKLKTFVIPNGGNLLSSQLFLARAVCRRAERSLHEHMRRENLNPFSEKEPNIDNILIFINRLSDYLFALARYTSTKEVLWFSSS